MDDGGFGISLSIYVRIISWEVFETSIIMAF